MTLRTEKLELAREEYEAYVEAQAQSILDRVANNGGALSLATNNHDNYGWNSKLHRAMPSIVSSLKDAGICCQGPTVSHGVTDWYFAIAPTNNA